MYNQGWWVEVGIYNGYGPIVTSIPKWFWADSRGPGNYFEHDETAAATLSQKVRVYVEYAGGNSWNIKREVPPGAASTTMGASTSNPPYSLGAMFGSEMFATNAGTVTIGFINSQKRSGCCSWTGLWPGSTTFQNGPYLVTVPSGTNVKAN